MTSLFMPRAGCLGRTTFDGKPFDDPIEAHVTLWSLVKRNAWEPLERLVYDVEQIANDARFSEVFYWVTGWLDAKSVDLGGLMRSGGIEDLATHCTADLHRTRFCSRPEEGLDPDMVLAALVCACEYLSLPYQLPEPRFTPELRDRLPRDEALDRAKARSGKGATAWFHAGEFERSRHVLAVLQEKEGA